MCYKKDTDPITTDLSFCAVADVDCSDGYDFMPAYELSVMDSPPRKCRLCQTKDLERYSLHQSVVESGRCVSDDDEYGLCALESTDCNDSEVFQSSARLRENTVMRCHANHLSGGECTNADVGEVHCTNYANACVTPSSFVKRSTCTIFSDTDSQNNEPMYFGACKKKQGDSAGLEGIDHRCVWHSSECNDEEEEWTPASKPMDWYDGCKCEDVETGACDDNGKYYCAVSSDACAVDHTYVPSLEIKEKGIDCRLCQRSRVASIPTTSPSNNPTKSATKIPTISPTKIPTKSPTKRTFKFSTNSPTIKDDNTFPPTTSEFNKDMFDDDGRETFPPTTSLWNNQMLLEDDDYDSADYDDDDYVSDEKLDSRRRFDVILILSGSIGGTLCFTCLAVFFYYQTPLPVKLYLTDKEVKGDVV